MTITAFPDFRLGSVRFDLKPNEDLHIYFPSKTITKLKNKFREGFLYGALPNFAWEAIKLIRDPAKSLFDLFSKVVFTPIFKGAVKAGIYFGLLNAGSFAAQSCHKTYMINRKVLSNWQRTFPPNLGNGEEVINSFLEDRGFISEERAREVTCPINQTFMLSPTELACNPGHVFDRVAIETWRNGRGGSCPLCRKVVDVTNMKHSEITFAKSCHVVQKIYDRLRAFNAPEGVNIMRAREVIQVLGYRINERNNCLYEHSLNYIHKQGYQGPQLQAINTDLLAWKNAVDIRMEG